MTKRLLVVLTVAFQLVVGGAYASTAKAPDAADQADLISEIADLSADSLQEQEETFVQEGKATWYGKAFHGRPTTSGEKYNMHAMTAAHRTLPFGTYVKVTNPANRKAVVVRINDRGPFAKNRIVDLSFAAAEKLGIVHKGPVPVRLTALGFKKKNQANKVTYTPADFDAGKFMILLSIYKDQETARRLAEELKGNAEFAGIKKLKRKSGIVYRVFAGTYTSLKTAEEARERFEKKGYEESLVVAAF